LRINDAARQLGVSHRSVRNLIVRGELAPVHRVGNLILIPRDTLSSFLSNSIMQPTQAAAT
jgi:excisionase family DNA binding protein